MTVKVVPLIEPVTSAFTNPPTNTVIVILETVWLCDTLYVPSVAASIPVMYVLDVYVDKAYYNELRIVDKKIANYLSEIYNDGTLTEIL